VPQALVISDANILIDMEAGGLLRLMFRLDFRFAVPDVLFEMELREHHPGLARFGLRRMELSGDSVRYVETLASDARAKGVGRYDLFALALARQENCLLLTGDTLMRTLAEDEGREVHGTLWLVGQMVEARVIVARQTEAAYERMRRAGRRLPWEEVEQQLRTFRK
jgi:predicted nucleic acid-binding protein